MGYYLPAGHERSESERAVLKEAASWLPQMLADNDIREDEVIADFKRWLRGRRK